MIVLRGKVRGVGRYVVRRAFLGGWMFVDGGVHTNVGR